MNQETQQKYHDYNESKSIEYFFNGFDSLDIVDGGEAEPICLYVEGNSISTADKGRRVDAHCKVCRFSIDLPRKGSLNSDYSTDICGADNRKR